MEPFDKIAHQQKMKTAVDKLVSHFHAKGILFCPTDDGDGKNHENVVFMKGDAEVKISHHSFYRYSGIACVYKEKGENQIEAIEVTDEMYLTNFMKPILETFLK